MIRLSPTEDPSLHPSLQKNLGKLLGYSLALSTTYHPQTDGETEQVNQELEVYLRIFCQNNPFSWADHLPTAEFAHNHHPHSVTNQSPFYLMYGYEPRLLPSVISETHIPAAESRIKELSEARNEALAAHDIACKVMRDRSTAKFSPFQKGDKVWLEARNLKCLYENCKFVPKCEGPFLISEVLSPITYCLAIPMKWKIHNMFHASLLSPYSENNVHGPNYMRPPPDLVKGEEEYEVEAILSHRGSARNRSYLVRWKGYSLANDSWEPETHLVHAADLLTAYKRQHPKVFFPRTTTPIISVNRISLNMPATRTIPFARRLRQPAHEQVLHTHKLFLDDSLHASPLFLALDPDSPLYLVYHAALQSFRVENMAKYLDGDKPNLHLTKTILKTVTMELIPDLMQLFDQLRGADLIYNIRNAHTNPSTRPSGGESASSSNSSAPLPVRVHMLSHTKQVWYSEHGR